MMRKKTTNNWSVPTNPAPAPVFSFSLIMTLVTAAGCSSETEEKKQSSRVTVTAPSGIEAREAVKRTDSLSDAIEAINQAQRSQESSGNQPQQPEVITVVDNETHEVLDQIVQEPPVQETPPATAEGNAPGTIQASRYPNLVTVFQINTAQNRRSFTLNGTSSGSVPIFQMFPATGADLIPIYQCVHTDSQEGFFDDKPDCSGHPVAKSGPFGWIFSNPPDGIDYWGLYICEFESAREDRSAFTDFVVAYPRYDCPADIGISGKILGYVPLDVPKKQ